ncbi:hypothetical protein F4604DRAFT_1924940 [Suillus subluteus]|nr:hypothetical protein F4604DRAFT_1924940 [Suillus subluteus]
MNFILNYNWACTCIFLQARIADQHPEGLSMDKLAEAVNLDEIKIARVLRALTLMNGFTEGIERNVFANNRLYPLILKSSNKTGCYARLHLQGVSKITRVFYDTMIDEEFATSHKVDKAPRLFGL